METSSDHQKDIIENPELNGRVTLSIEPFLAVARELAERFNEPIATCLRDSHQPGAAAIPYHNKLLQEAQSDGSRIISITRPEERRD